jgi:hypothetical protein
VVLALSASTTPLHITENKRPIEPTAREQAAGERSWRRRRRDLQIESLKGVGATPGKAARDCQMARNSERLKPSWKGWKYSKFYPADTRQPAELQEVSATLGL